MAPLELELDNPVDSAAIAAVDLPGRVTGNVATESSMREAVDGGGAGVSARVLAVELKEQGFSKSCWWPKQAITKSVTCVINKKRALNCIFLSLDAEAGFQGRKRLPVRQDHLIH